MSEPLNADIVEHLRESLQALDKLTGLTLTGELTATYGDDIVGYVQVNGDTETTFTQAPRDA